jgi:hypothetical protein
MVEAMVSIRPNGTIRFDRKALNEFRGLGIEFAVFHDERLNRTTGRPLTAVERRALSEGKGRTGARSGDEVRDFLPDVGIRTLKRRRYKARWWMGKYSNSIIVRIR